MNQNPKLGPDPSKDAISTGRMLKKLFTGEMTFSDLLSSDEPAPIVKTCTRSVGCTEPDGHADGCCFLASP